MFTSGPDGRIVNFIQLLYDRIGQYRGGGITMFVIVEATILHDITQIKASFTITK